MYNNLRSAHEHNRCLLSSDFTDKLFFFYDTIFNLSHTKVEPITHVFNVT